MALSDAIAALFGWRRVVVYDHSVVAATIQGMTADDLYRKQPALRAVVSFLADNVAGIPLKCYERRGDADRPRDNDSDLALLLRRPCRGMTTHELVRATVSDYLLRGNALWYLYPDPEAPAGMWVRYVPWAWVHGKETHDGFEPSAYEVANPYTGARASLPAEDCIRFFSYDPRGLVDTSSALEALREVLSEQISAWEYRNGVWRNGGRVSQWISRPANVPWEPGARDRFAKSWKSRFAGKDATDTGGTPLLEDGMRLETTTFNAREAQWQEATRLAREDVAAVYHVNPSLIWHTDGQTYASAKDNARALYADTLTPLLDMVEERLNGFLVPMLGMDPATHYCEFDLSSKLAASFEEQASVLQSSVGGPWMLRNEARARMNLPALPGGDELIVPLNVSEGGLAAPNDTDPTVERYNARPALDVHVEPLAKGGYAVPFGEKAEVRVRVKVRLEVERSVSDVLARFCARQRDAYVGELSKIDLTDADLAAIIKAIYEDKSGTWLNDAIADLYDCAQQPMSSAATRSMALLGADPDELDITAISDLVREMCVHHASAMADEAMNELVEAAGAIEDLSARSVRALVHDTFRKKVEPYVEGRANAMATHVANAGACEGARQSKVKCQKKWVCTGHNSRPEHLALNGTRVGLDDMFPLEGGARWPGDTRLSAGNSCNCHCRIDIVSSGKNVMRARRTRDVASELGLSDYKEEKLDAAIMRCQQTVDCGGRLWEELEPQEKASTIAELRTRDPDWVAFGRIPNANYEKPREALEPHEQKGVDWLLNNGIVPTVVLEDPNADANIDLVIWGQDWEMKNVTNSRGSAKTQLRRAKAKWKELNLDTPVRAVMTLDGCTDDFDTVVTSLRNKGGYKELLIVSADRLVRVTK